MKGEGDLDELVTHLVLLLKQDLVIFRECSTEYNTCDDLEIVYPLSSFTLRTLPTNIDHMY
jgi:hypothetical protein